ncbi:hypothetical protein AcV7_005763 [Taiwanofungus camphoratus]|nr:hypothetical protein AcW2_007149 [Antrodia cinnamomea]KAI0923178.1 hypothetical protein AcV7_005763 [Antrodia cinnamomea]
MPRDLPGLYWDDERKRYFSLSSRPASPTKAPPAAPGPASQHEHDAQAHAERPVRASDPDGHHAKRRRVYGVEDSDVAGMMWRASERTRASASSVRMSSSAHDILGANIACTARGCSYYIADADVTAFLSTFDSSHDGGPFQVMAGDAQGWLHSFCGIADHATRAREFSLASSISSICMSGTRCVAVSFGPPCKIVVGDLEPTETWTILSLPKEICHDVWAAHLLGRSLALGAAKRAIRLPDIDIGTGFQTFDAGSDVLVVHQEEHLIYTGARNGCIGRFDTRVDSHNMQELLAGRFEQTTSSITHLSIVLEWQLLVSTIRGDLETHDLRFLRNATPVLQFPGHVNSYTTKLGLAVNPAQDFLFASGQDRRVRVWSLRTGRPLRPPPQSSRPSRLWVHALPGSLETDQLFSKEFDAPVAALQVTQSEKGACLWAAAAGELHRYHLGQLGGLA